MKNLDPLQEIFFPVEKISSNDLFKGYNFAQGKTSCIYSPEKNKVLNVCSDDYNLVSNESLFLPVYEELVNRYGRDMLEVKVKNVDDRKFYVTMVINNRPFNIQKGDVVNPTVQLSNSYDGTMKFGMATGFHRVVCSNGMMAFQQVSAQEKKHKAGGVSFANLFKMLDNVDAQLKRFKALHERRLTPKEVEELTEIIKSETNFPKRLIEEVPGIIAGEMQKFDTGVTAWLLYHGFNNRLNHADILMHQEFKVRIDEEVLSKIESFN